MRETMVEAAVGGGKQRIWLAERESLPRHGGGLLGCRALERDECHEQREQ